MRLVGPLLKIARGFTLNNRLPNIGAFKSVDHPKLPKAEFEKIAQSKILRYLLAFNQLKECDPKIEYVALSGYNGALSIGVKEIGVYKIWPEAESSVVYLFSPQSGTYSYFYNSDQGQWENTKDGHFLEELLTREFLKFSKGYLDF